MWKIRNYKDPFESFLNDSYKESFKKLSKNLS